MPGVTGLTKVGVDFASVFLLQMVQFRRKKKKEEQGKEKKM